TVGALPATITQQPSNLSVTTGGTASFSVTASGCAPLSYLWRRNGTPISGATALTYTTNNVQLADSGSQFSCLVSNVYGTVLSSNAILVVVTNNGNVLISGIQLNSTNQSYLAALNYLSTVVPTNLFGSVSFAGFNAIWLGGESTFAGLAA